MPTFATITTGPCGPLRSDLASGWVEALGTLGAFAVALYLAGVAITDRTNRQASLVSAYVVSGVLRYPKGHTIDRPTPSTMPSVAMAWDSATGLPVGAGHGKTTLAETCTMLQWAMENRSDEMISNVEVSLLDEDGAVIHQVGPYPVVRPNHEEGSSDFLLDPEGKIGGVIQARVTFQDARGRRWSRVSGQRLRRVRGKW